MKRFLLAITLLLTLSSFDFPGYEDIVAAFKTSNAANVARYFDTRVSITISEKSDDYSKQQAEMILRDFFTLHPVKNFTIIHKGENGNSQFYIGTLSCSDDDFRVTFYVKMKNSVALLQSIRVEE
jgi:hypothetical protein